MNGWENLTALLGWAVGIWLLIINVVAVYLTVSDKAKERKKKWRVPENTLLLVAALGGSPAMLLTMLKIHHKTRHPKFMVGIPLILLLQIALVGFLLWKF